MGGAALPDRWVAEVSACLIHIWIVMSLVKCWKVVEGLDSVRQINPRPAGCMRENKMWYGGIMYVLIHQLVKFINACEQKTPKTRIIEIIDSATPDIKKLECDTLKHFMIL